MYSRFLNKTYLVILLAILTISCDSEKKNKIDYFTSFMNQEISIPEEYVYIVDTDTVDLDLENVDFKIITYIPGEKCIPCNMHLAKWSRMIEELHSAVDRSIEFLMVINSKPTDELLGNIEKNNFLNPIAFDPENRLKSTNKLPEHEVNTVLLDDKNRIVAIGDPSANPMIWDLYRQLMDLEMPDDGLTDLCAQPVLPLGAISANDTVVKRFHISNPGPEQLILRDVIPSCDCIHTSVTADTIPPKGHIFLSAKIPVEDSYGLTKKYVNVFIKDKIQPLQLTLYGYITNNSNKQKQ